MDLLYIPQVISKRIYDYLYEKFKLTKSEIFFNASHTHSAPGIDINFDKLIDYALDASIAFDIADQNLTYEYSSNRTIDGRIPSGISVFPINVLTGSSYQSPLSTNGRA